MNLHHRRQEGVCGCLYHALYALTGDQGVLAYVADISNPRFYARLHKLGLMAVALYVGSPAPPSVWETLAPGEHALLLSIDARTLGAGIEHAVAVSLRPGAGATVSDSRYPELREHTWPAFLASEYAAPRRIEAIAPADVEAYPYEDGAALVYRSLAASRPDPHPDLTL